MMNVGYLLITAFASLSTVILASMLFYADWFSWLALGVSLGVLFTQVVETFKEEKYLTRFRNIREIFDGE